MGGYLGWEIGVGMEYFFDVLYLGRKIVIGIYVCGFKLWFRKRDVLEFRVNVSIVIVLLWGWVWNGCG